MTPDFEEWARSLNINLAKKTGGDGYAFTAAVYAWKAWQEVTNRTLGRDEGDCAKLTVFTRHPEDYVLLNEEDGSRWRGYGDGIWRREK